VTIFKRKQSATAKHCLGSTCADVGAYTGTTVCTDPVASSDAATAPALALGAAAAAAGAALLL